MAALIATKGPNAGQRFALDEGGTLIGRQPDVAGYLDSLSVRPPHTRIFRTHGAYFIVDLGSSSGTYVNGLRVNGKTGLTEHDELRIGPYTFHLHMERPAPPSGVDPIVRASVDATASNATLFSQNAAYKLKVV